MKKSDVYNRIKKYCTTHFTKLNPNDFVLGDAPFNRKCHLNSVQAVKEGRAVKVFACYCYDRSDNSQCIHFINQLADGKYQDNTWGWIREWNDYYIIKEISPEEQEHIWDSLVDTRSTIVNMCSTRFERFILKLKPLNCI